MGEVKVSAHEAPKVLVRVRPGRAVSKAGRLFHPGELLRLRSDLAEREIRAGLVEKATDTDFHGRDNEKGGW